MISTLDFESIRQDDVEHSDNDPLLLDDLDQMTLDGEFIGLWPAILKVLKREW